jgi:hypothetical protein
LSGLTAKRRSTATYILTSTRLAENLFFQLPAYFLVGQSVGAAETVKSILSGQGANVDAKMVRQKWSWVHPSMVGGSVGLAALVAAFSIRPEKVQSIRHQAPVGVRDYVREQQRQAERKPEEEGSSRLSLGNQA